MLLSLFLRLYTYCYGLGYYHAGIWRRETMGRVCVMSLRREWSMNVSFWLEWIKPAKRYNVLHSSAEKDVYVLHLQRKRASDWPNKANQAVTALIRSTLTVVPELPVEVFCAATTEFLKLETDCHGNQFNFKEAQMGIKSVQMFCTLTRHTRFIMNFSYWTSSLKMFQPCLLE